jgi:hypothetical protein
MPPCTGSEEKGAWVLGFGCGVWGVGWDNVRQNLKRGQATDRITHHFFISSNIAGSMSSTPASAGVDEVEAFFAGLSGLPPPHPRICDFAEVDAAA